MTTRCWFVAGPGFVCPGGVLAEVSPVATSSCKAARFWLIGDSHQNAAAAAIIPVANNSDLVFGLLAMIA